jgi:hypothetical protein
MGRTQRMRRDLITVAVVVVLLVGLLLLLSSGAAFAQSAAEDQYSSSSGATTFPSSTFRSPNPFPDDSGATTWQPEPFWAGPAGFNAPAMTVAGGNLPSGGFPPNLGVGGGGVLTPAPPMVPFLVPPMVPFLVT